ncbi:MAG: hypothetical protein J5865_00430, partial [Lachnospiraceae bacterium]|nr:hypothetical protein [Lachnospiraceae bacterium]
MARFNNEPERPRPSIAKFASWVNPVSGEEAEDVKVRKATAADAEAICGFLKEMRDEQARKRPDIVNREEDILSLEEVKDAIEDGTKLVFVAENKDGKVLGQILCELEGTEETAGAVSELLLGEVGAAAPVAEAVEEAAEAVAEAAEPVVDAVEEVVESAAEAAEPVVEAVEEAAEAVAEAAAPVVGAVEEVVESAAEAAEPIPAAPDPLPDEPEEAALAKPAFTAKKLIIANIFV